MRQVDCCIWVIYLFLLHFALWLRMVHFIFRFSIILFGVTLWCRRCVYSALVKVSNALITITLRHGFHILWCFLTLCFLLFAAAVSSFWGTQERKTQFTLETPNWPITQCRELNAKSQRVPPVSSAHSTPVTSTVPNSSTSSDTSSLALLENISRSSSCTLIFLSSRCLQTQLSST